MDSRLAILDDLPYLKAAVADYAEALNKKSDVIAEDYVLGELLPALIANKQVIVIVKNDFVVGTAAGGVCASPFNPDLSYFVELFWWVHKDYRSSGVGSKLLTKYEELAKSSGADVCTMNLLGGTPDLTSVEKHLEKKGYAKQEVVFSKILGD